jgi:putative ABC transport system permease protein
MTRLIDEDRSNIGALKALGYNKWKISSKYLLYSLATGVAGSLAGMLVGFTAIPVIVYNAFGTMYHLPPIVWVFDWIFALRTCLLILLCMEGVTVYTCYATLREKPSELMRPRAPRPGKRILLEYIGPLWRGMKFTWKVSARNLLRYKRRFFMTVVGVAGCTALMLIGFGLRDSLSSIAIEQFDRIFRYDLRIDLSAGGEEDTALDAFLTGKPYLEVRREALTVATPSGVAVNITATVPLHRDGVAEELGDYIELRDMRSGKPLVFDASSCIITEKLSETLRLRPGAALLLENADGKKGIFTITGVTENYVGAYVYAGQDAWRAAYGGEPTQRALLVQTRFPPERLWTDAENDALSSLLQSDAVEGIEFNSRTQESYTNLLTSVNFVVLVLIIAAGGLAVIVLYNLTNINISERSRELATLRVLGFHQKEAAWYIFREILVLSIVGALSGLLLGIPLHRFIISIAENPDLMFGRSIALISYILSFAATIAFSIVVNIMMLSKIRSISMAESMKAAE